MTRTREIEQRAAQWLIQREQLDWSADRASAFQMWLDESAAHKAAFWRLEAGWRAADRLAATHSGRPSPPVLRWTPAQVGWAIAASLLILCAAGIALWQFFPPSTSSIRVATAVGARKQVALADGSAVMVNTASTVRASFAQGKRRIWLDRGEAYFEVAHDLKRPFIVFAGGRKVTVLGTKFSVRRDRDTVTVAVVEGRVRVEDSNPSSGERAAIITAGDIAIARGPSMLLADRSEQRVQDGLTWRRGVLTFDQVTLAQAASEFNRYNRRQIRVDDPQAAQLRIGGSFEATNVDAFTRLLRDAFGLHITSDKDGVTIKS